MTPTLPANSRAIKPIYCTCPQCHGRTWALAKVRALPGIKPTQSINGRTLAGISKATGHDFTYSRDAESGWRMNIGRRGAKDSREEYPPNAGGINVAPRLGGLTRGQAAGEVLPWNPLVTGGGR